MNSEIVKLLTNRQNYLIIEKQVSGNFLKYVGDDDTCYTSKWAHSDNEYYDFIFSDDGSCAFLICKKDCDTDIDLSLEMIPTYNTTISFTIDMHDNKSEWHSFVMCENKKTHISGELSDIPKNAQFKILFKILDGKVGTIITTIKNILCLTNAKINTKIPVAKLSDFISTTVKRELKLN